MIICLPDTDRHNTHTNVMIYNWLVSIYYNFIWIDGTTIDINLDTDGLEFKKYFDL